MLAAFAYARMDFPGKKLLFSIQLATLMIPGVVHIIPAFMIMKTLGWINTHYPLIVPHFLGGAFGTFLLRQFFLTIPREYDDAAKIDGAGHLVILARIYAPLAKPALATLAVFTFMASWNDFLGPIIYLTSEKLMTLQVGLQYFRGQYQVQTNLLMAGAVITVAPIVGLYVVAQKYFVQGVTMSGLKG
jgi:multiple sugar transport system permease protein